MSEYPIEEWRDGRRFVQLDPGHSLEYFSRDGVMWVTETRDSEAVSLPMVDALRMTWGEMLAHRDGQTGRTAPDAS